MSPYTDLSLPGTRKIAPVDGRFRRGVGKRCRAVGMKYHDGARSSAMAKADIGWEVNRETLPRALASASLPVHIVPDMFTLAGRRIHLPSRARRD